MDIDLTLGNLVDLLGLDSGDDQGPATPMRLEREIRLDKVSFRYPARDEPVLSDVGLVIPKGSRTAIVGQTGSGKSTLVDIVMGLLAPSSGAILIDGAPLTPDRMKVWQANIAHVPQAIFLSDKSILSNIAFGVPADRTPR